MTGCQLLTLKGVDVDYDSNRIQVIADITMYSK